MISPYKETKPLQDRWVFFYGQFFILKFPYIKLNAVYIRFSVTFWNFEANHVDLHSLFLLQEKGTKPENKLHENTQIGLLFSGWNKNHPTKYIYFMQTLSYIFCTEFAEYRIKPSQSIICMTLLFISKYILAA